MMTPREILEAARAGDLELRGVEREGVADAVRQFAKIGDAASALELIGRTWRLWLSSGELEEGSSLVAAALATPGASGVPVWEVRALYADGAFAFRSGDQKRSRAANEKALRIARAAGDVRGECEAMTGLARLALRDGQYGEVVALASQARERAVAAHEREAEGPPLHLLAAGTRLQRNYLAARELYLESLDLNSDLGNARLVAMELHNLGWVELHLGNIDNAKARFHERDVATGADAYGNAWTELNWAAVAAAEGAVIEAQRRFDIGTRAIEALGVALDPDDLSELEWLREQVQTRGR